jgi:pimeloyl-ACP methyl ester carboxylesterase
MPIFRHDDIEFHYQESGSGGRPFVFQHGLGGDVHQPFGLFTPPAGVRLLAFDARGHGQTRPLGDVAKLNFKTFGDDLQAFLQYLGLERSRIVLGGISMGASLALSFALRHPEQLEALVLSRPAWLEEPCPYNLKMFTLISTLLLNRGAERGLAEFQATTEYQEALARWPDAARSFSLQFQNPRGEETAVKLERLIRDRPHPERSAWSTIKVPTLVLGNRCDPVHPFEFAEELSRAIPGTEFCEVTSKSVSVDRHTADVQQALETFLAKLAKPKASRSL